MPARQGQEPTRKATTPGPLKLAPTASFAKDFQVLPKEIQARTEKAIVRLVQNPAYPSLRVKKMQGWRISGKQALRCPNA
jgi:mRNA-degrading endonuclease RelE of RelBE toxin-antitoxin system